MKLNAPSRILAVAAVCATILVAFVINEGTQRANGQEVLLSVQGVDPRDLLSGHYVELVFNRELLPGEQCPTRQSDWDWVALKRRGDIFVVAGAAASRSEAEQVGPLPVRGAFECTPPSPAQEIETPASPGWIRLNIGIDRFYVSQAEAQRIERALAEQRNDHSSRVLAIVSVGRDGAARLKGLVVDNRRLELNWL